MRIRFGFGLQRTPSIRSPEEIPDEPVRDLLSSASSPIVTPGGGGGDSLLVLGCSG
jgi:hypothetical protein